MPLTINQKESIANFIPAYLNYIASQEYADDVQDKENRIVVYGELLSAAGISRMTELEFGQVVSSLWSYAMWGNKGFLVDDLLRDNPLEQLKPKLHKLLWGNETLVERYNNFRNSTKSFGPATITELLSFVHPEYCGLWNKKTRLALPLLGFSETLPFLKKYQINGAEYETLNNLLFEIRDELTSHNLPAVDLLGINYFLYAIRNKDEGMETPLLEGASIPPTITDFDHDEAIDQLLTIGQWLGFEVEKEKLISPGSKVDVIWQARVANLGVVTYVFEVQRHGNRDSLIINLMNAQNNPTVQRLVVVALVNELEQIKVMVENLPENFRRIVGYMNVIELIRASDLVTELSGIINKLELVKSEFGA